MSFTRPNPSVLSRIARARQQFRTYAAPGEGSIPAAKKKYVPTSGTYPLGFRAGSAHVGVKPSNTRFDDLTLVASDQPCSAAAVFTTNKFQAAPVTVSRDMLKRRKGDGVRAVVVNSGCANAVTGRGGIEDAISMGTKTDQCFVENNNGDDGQGSRSIVMSTGVIGQRFVVQMNFSEHRLTTLDFLFKKSQTRFPLHTLISGIPTTTGSLRQRRFAQLILFRNSSLVHLPSHHPTRNIVSLA